MSRSKKDIADMYKSPFPVALRTLMSEKPITTQEKLAEITGKTRQTVSQYVNGISEPGYDTLIKIADFFDVSTDYLLGRTADRLRKPSVVDDLGISESVSQWFKNLKAESTDNDNLSAGVNDILGNSHFQAIVRMLRNYTESVKAEAVYHYICHIVPHNSPDFRKRVTAEVYKIAESNIYGDTMSKCLIGQDYVVNIDVCANPVVADILCDGIVSGFSEIYASQVSRELTHFLQDIMDKTSEMQTNELHDDFYARAKDHQGGC